MGFPGLHVSVTTNVSSLSFLNESISYRFKAKEHNFPFGGKCDPLEGKLQCCLNRSPCCLACFIYDGRVVFLVHLKLAFEIEGMSFR